MKSVLRLVAALPLLVLSGHALAASAIETFETAPSKDTPLASYVSPVGTFSPIAGLATNVFVASAGYDNFGVAGLTGSAILTANGNEAFNLDLAFNASIVALDVYLNDLGPATLNFYGGATLLKSLSFDVAQPNFLSVSYTNHVVPITRLTFVSTSGYQINTGLDNVAVTSFGVVPEPASWAIMTAGFALAGAALRGRTRRTTRLPA